MTGKRRGTSFSWCKITIFPVKTTIYFSQHRDECASGCSKGSGYFHSTHNGISERIVFPEILSSVFFAGNYYITNFNR
jgi:hypothetical protein